MGLEQLWTKKILAALDAAAELERETVLEECLAKYRADVLRTIAESLHRSVTMLEKTPIRRPKSEGKIYEFPRQINP